MKISNNSIIVLLFIAIIASISGTFFAMNFLSEIVTGAATTTGNVTLTIPSSADCTASDNLIAFGTLAQGGSNQSEPALDFIVVNNTGNVNLKITAAATVELFSTQSAPSIYWQIHCNTTLSGVCNNTYHPVHNTGSVLITALDYSDIIDNVTIGINVTVPNDEPTGDKNGELTFTCLEG
jgi:hypothetical protein